MNGTARRFTAGQVAARRCRDNQGNDFSLAGRGSARQGTAWLGETRQGLQQGTNNNQRRMEMIINVKIQ
jgi:hypothetical protein